MTHSLVRSIGSAALAVGMAVAAPAIAAAQTPQKDASLTGTWTMGLIGDHVIPVALVLDQNGSALTGTFIFMGKDFPVTGNVADGKILLKGKGPGFGVRPAHDAGLAAGGAENHKAPAGPTAPGVQAALADMTITGTVDADGALAGTLATKVGEGTGTIKWTAERLKERKVPSAQAAVSTEGVSLTGRWKLNIVEAQVPMDVELTQAGTKVTGTGTSEHLGTMKIEGTFVAGTLTFVASGEAMGQQVKIEFAGKYTSGGTFAGEAQSQMGPLTWTAERVKK
jgi:hypothetical protein